VGKISVVINTLNEEKNLPCALTSVKNFANEIVICDMHSDDGTVEIAKKYGAKVYKHKKTGYVEPARNYAINKATGDWILILDADEEISSSLRKSLGEIADEQFHTRRAPSATLGVSIPADYYRLPRKNIIFGKWVKYSGWWPDYNIRFFRKGYVSWSEIIHSVPETRGKGLDLEADEKNAIVHYHYQTVEQFIDRLNRYTSIQSRELIKDKYEFDWRDLIKKPVGEFLSRYFQAEGYKDGLHGLTLSMLQAFSEFVKYLKVWQLNSFKLVHADIEEVVEMMKRSEGELHYWESNALLKEVGGLKHRIKRKFKLP